MTTRTEMLMNVVQALDPRADADDVLLRIVRLARSTLGAAGVAVVHPNESGLVEVRAGDIVSHGREFMRELFESACVHLRADTPEVEHLQAENRTHVIRIPEDPDQHLFVIWMIDEDDDDADPDRTFTATQRHTVEVLVDLAGARLVRGHGIDAVTRKALRREQDRIARDLHDVVVQRIYAAGLQVKAAIRIDDVERSKAGLQAVLSDLDEVIRDVRSVIYDLDHAVDSTVRENLRALVEEYGRVLGFLPVLRTEGDLSRLDGVVADHLLATARELLSNVARHSGATRCRVEVTHRLDELTLVINDDGCGIGPEVWGEGRRSGLENLKLRAQLMAGTLQVTPGYAPGDPAGTTVQWTVPSRRV